MRKQAALVGGLMLILITSVAHAWYNSFTRQSAGNRQSVSGIKAAGRTSGRQATTPTTATRTDIRTKSPSQGGKSLSGRGAYGYPARSYGRQQPPPVCPPQQQAWSSYPVAEQHNPFYDGQSTRDILSGVFDWLVTLPANTWDRLSRYVDGSVYPVLPAAQGPRKEPPSSTKYLRR